MFRVTLISLSILAYLGCVKSNTRALNYQRIVGGEIATGNSYPYQASIWTSGTYSCSGAIITSRTILTSAQCLVGKSAEDTTVEVGVKKLTEVGTEYQAETLIIHPQFSNQLLTSDVGLIILEESIAFNEKVASIPLDNDFIEGGVDALVTGWGMVKYPDVFMSENLKVLNTKTITVPECKDRMTGFGGPIIESSLCTFTRSGEGVCYGDSGSPLVADGKVVGVSSWFSPCANGRPDVFARISSFTSWIDANKV